MVAGFPLVPGSARNLFQFIKVWKSLEKKRCPWKYLNQFLKLPASVLQCMLSMACHVCFVHYCSKLHCVRQLCVIISNTHRSSCNTWTVLYWISTETCSLLGVAPLRAYGKKLLQSPEKVNLSERPGGAVKQDDKTKNVLIVSCSLPLGHSFRGIVWNIINEGQLLFHNSEVKFNTSRNCAVVFVLYCTVLYCWRWP